MTEPLTEPRDHLLALDRPALLVGITGAMRLVPGDVEFLRENVKLVLLFLRDGGKAAAPVTMPNGTTTWLADVLAERLAPRDADRGLHRFYRGTLRRWRPLKNTPIVVLSALAPGADSIVAEEALKLGLRVAAPLPFPRDQFRNCSTFVWKEATDAENLQRQKEFDKLVGTSQSVNSFHVPLAEDHELSVEQRRQLTQKDMHENDSTGKPKRHTRYFAAGEYLASHCHLLLAMWGGEQEQSREGTSAVVEARLLGPRHGVLPSSSHLAVPHGGPVLHLFARKETNPAAGQSPTAGAEITAGSSRTRESSVRNLTTSATTATATPIPTPPEASLIAAAKAKGLPLMRLLHPYSFERNKPTFTDVGKVIAPRQHQNRKLQRDRLATFFRMVRNLERFNSRKIPAWAERNRDKEFRDKRLARAGADGKPSKLSDGHPLFASEFFRGLRRISDLRGDAVDGSSWFSARANATLRRLFALTLVAAVMFHIFSEWHPRPAHQPSAFKSVVGGSAFVLATISLLCYAIRRSRSYEEQQEDERALGEGLRVQFYWNLAGLGQSVSANYMQRQRSELDWIRGAIRSVSIPYHWWADEFNQLLPEHKLDALRCVQAGWIQEQLGYFAETYRKRQHSLHNWHKLGFVSSLAGLVSLAACWLAFWSKRFAEWLEAHRGQLGGWAIELLLVAVVWRLAVWCIEARRKALETKNEETFEHGKHEQHHTPTWIDSLAKFKPPKRKSGGRNETERRTEPWCWFVVRCLAHWQSAILGLLHKLVDDLVPLLDPASRTAAGFFELLMRRIYNLATLLPLSLATAALTLLAVLVAAEHFPEWPEAGDLGIIVGGVLLLCGALAIAWTEKNLDSELSYQFNTMALLFKHASLRMARELDRLERLHQQLQESASDKTAHQAKLAEFDRALHEIQCLLSDLGKEALDENAEWLILHRARPLEPVMAG